MSKEEAHDEDPNRRLDQAHQARSGDVRPCVCGRLARCSVALPPLMGDADSAGRIDAILESLMRERRRLQHGVPEESLIEANTKAIAYWHHQLEQRRTDAAPRAAVLRGPSSHRR
jgi:hypothetical protein